MDQESVLELVRARGPIIPSQISKDLGTNILLASAILSEFASRNLIKVSNIKVGGSPLYYVAGQEEKLSEFIGRLPDKEKTACIMLRESKILRDSLLEPAMRVAIRQCKDFAKPLEVTINSQKELFWKWHTIDNVQAESAIKGIIGEQRVQEQKKTDQKQEQDLSQFREKPSDQLKLQKPKRLEFDQLMASFFSDKRIKVAKGQIIKKNFEMVYEVKMPTPLGDLSYLCIAKNKSRCNEADVSHACVQGQIRKLPVIFLTTGQLTKKAEELMKNSEFSNLTFIKV